MAEKKIAMVIGKRMWEIVLNDSETAFKIYEALPIKSVANRWGKEIYFEIPVNAELENGKELVEKGDVGYWPTGRAFCVFWGPTPISAEGEIRPASAVSVVGKVVSPFDGLDDVSDGDEVLLKRIE